MEQDARNFARWVLAVHLAALLVIAVLVILAAREVYTAARKEAMDQAQRRQELLALQTARGVEGFYQSILDNLDLERRAADPDLTEGRERPGSGKFDRILTARPPPLKFGWLRNFEIPGP